MKHEPPYEKHLVAASISEVSGGNEASTTAETAGHSQQNTAAAAAATGNTLAPGILILPGAKSAKDLAQRLPKDVCAGLLEQLALLREANAEPGGAAIQEAGQEVLNRMSKDPAVRVSLPPPSAKPADAPAPGKQEIYDTFFKVARVADDTPEAAIKALTASLAMVMADAGAMQADSPGISPVEWAALHEAWEAALDAIGETLNENAEVHS